MRDDERGQVLPLVAIMLVALFAMAALAVDVSNAYAARQAYRTAADAAALAGAQDIQARTVTADAQRQARRDALDLLKEQLGATSDPNPADPGCSGLPTLGSNLDDCPLPGTPYHISIKTPSPSCSAMCSPINALQVTVDHPTFAVSFAHILGVEHWNVGVTSVAGTEHVPSYALVTLQPPHPKNNGTDANLNKDLVVKSAFLNILTGDIGTNTSATTTLQGTITLANGYYIDHFDDLSALGTPTWTQDVNGLPAGRQIPALIPDPRYMYPSFTGAPTFTSQSQGVVPCTGANFPSSDTRLPAGTVCYSPGIYSLGPHGNQPFSVGSQETVYLLPGDYGAYYFQSGLQVNGSLYGGLQSSRSGVVLRFPASATLNANNAVNFVLNMGGASCDSLDNSCKASPAIDFSGAAVKTSPGAFALTIEVDRNDACFSGAIPLDNASCELSSVDTTVNLAGSGSLQVAGVVYGPSDQMSINGNSTQGGYVGQIYSWTVAYTGNFTSLNQQYPGLPKAGVLRLDSACTAPGTPCNP